MLFLIDFDGTITLNDCIKEMLSNYASEEYLFIEDRWLKNEINSMDCLKLQFNLVKVKEKKIKEYFKNIKIDKFFKDFYNYANKIAKLAIVSDGIDYPIQVVLERLNIRDITYFSNKLHITYNGIDISFSHSSPSCIYQYGCCKCAIANSLHSGEKEKVILIGNGKSDFCLAHVVDIIFAKDQLKEYCIGCALPFLEFKTFADILDIIKKWK